MKIRTVLFSLLITLSLATRSEANITNTIINWLGNAGYRARISMSYDDSFAFVSARGGFPFGGPTNQGISQLSVAFYTPLSLIPVYSTLNVSGGVVTYKFLSIGFDTVSRTLTGSLDVGRDSFAEGDPGSSAGQYYLTGLSSPALHDSFLAQVVDSGGQFVTVPEPSTWALGGIGIVCFILLTRKRRLTMRCSEPGHRITVAIVASRGPGR